MTDVTASGGASDSLHRYGEWTGERDDHGGAGAHYHIAARRLDRHRRTTCRTTMSAFNEETVLTVHHWTDRLFSFTTTRDPSFRFRNGEFTMIGLKVGEKPLLRAVMRETKGNQVRAAELLGINRNTLRKKLKEHGIDPDAV